ncbi:hypothetical protein AJ79_00531 [Helicocarpus griseus UAMH5409]|uniref:Thioesterase domain-containing protein n=1 Tax=Helicocarpus griseus UAMH5409 TaxID=1447875 RepID=A0A2B7YBN4_9EURO|nr:hypothetical protein AJ79_00531 [Helicocarpus griseus UAMH5409]
MVNTLHYASYTDFITNHPLPQADLDFFTSHPYARPYLNPDNRDNNPYRPVPFLPRYDKKEDTTDRFFSKVINTPDTVPHLLALMRSPELNPVFAAAKASSSSHSSWGKTSGAQSAGTAAAAEGAKADPDYILLAHLATSLSGFRDTVHGGVLATLLDETLGNCVEGFREGMTFTNAAGGEKPRFYTANLQVSYRAPVMAPGVVVIKTWLRGREGRKWFLQGQVVGEDGVVKVEATSLWIMAREGGGGKSSL